MKRGAVIGIATGAAALVAAVGAVWWFTAQAPSAEQTAEAYLRALSEGDADALTGLIDDDTGGFAEIVEAFAGADSYLEEYTLEGIGDDGSARADVVLDGEQGVVFFQLGETPGGWRVDADYLASLDVTTTIGDAVRIGDVLQPAGPVSLLPAVYTLTAAPAGLVAGSTTVAVTNEEPLTAAVEASLAPEAVATAQAQLDAYLAACTAPATAVPANCGLRVPWAADLATLSSIAFRIDTAPVLTLSPDARSFAATGGVVVATATGTTRDGSTGAFTYRADDWAVRGTVSFTGDTMTLAVG